MVGKEDASCNSRAPCQLSSSRKQFWRSASWSASRTASQNPNAEECAEPNGNTGTSNGQGRRFPAPLTPRSQHNSKARSCLPPLQPLSIARRSLDEWPKAGSDDIGEWPQPPTPSGRSGERLKLDLSSIEQNRDGSCGLVKRDKIAFFDKKCSKVAEHIYLGGDAVAKDRDILKQNRITHVLNCVGFVCPEYFKADFVYRTLWLQDSPSEDITSILYDVFDYFEDVREQGGKVFVHCCQGVSRSTSLVIAYLMWREGQSFDDAFQYVKAAREIADPNMGFACQLLQCQKRVLAFPLSPSSLLRMYRIAPHSPYDPLHLVPKMLNVPSPSALDSRGAFIIHLPSAIYVWIGKNCEAIMERDARGAVCQIVRYEKVQGRIIMVKEGDEPAYFWDSFSNISPSLDKTGCKVEVGTPFVKIFPGDRKVDSYNVDFEIFQKAITGGFVPPFASSRNEHETHLPVRESSWSVLRRKFASGNMKEFISAPKLSLFSRVYSDSRMVVHPCTNSPSPSSSSLPLSSSPVYLSPDSISSDSSSGSKYFSESSLDSPCTSSLPLTPALSNLSLSSKISSLPTPNTPETSSVTQTLQSSDQAASSTCKNYSPSLAERRGSLSKSLKLPVISDNARVTKSSSNFLVSQEDDLRMSNDVCSLSEPDNIEIVLGSNDCTNYGGGVSLQDCKLNTSLATVTSADSSHRDTHFVNQCGESGRSRSLGEGLGSTISNAKYESGLIQGNLMQLLVCRWPSLERIVTFGRKDLDSAAAFAIFHQSAGLGKNEGGILYFWVGRSLNEEKSRVQLDRSREMIELQVIDWNQVALEVCSQMHLPKETAIKVIKEDEEPDEFAVLLNSLWPLPLGRNSAIK